MKLISKIKKKEKKDISIFYVEDELYYSKLLIANLNKIGFGNVTHFESGEELLLSLEDGNKPDILILDYIIKGGIDAFAIITEVKKYKLDTNIIILSGQSDVNKATMIIKNGASDYIVKNNLTFFNLENTLKKVEKIICLKLENEHKSKKTKLFYIGIIVLVWIGFIAYQFLKK